MRTKRAIWGLAALGLPLVMLGGCGDGGEDDETGRDPVFPEELTEPGVATWTTVIDGAQARVVGTDASGRIYTGGSFEDKIDFGNGAESTRGADDVYLARYNEDGALDWSVTIGTGIPDVITGLATSRFGEPAVGFPLFAGDGFVSGACSATPFDGTNRQAWYIVRLDPDSGECMWIRQVPHEQAADTSPMIGFDDAVFDADGNMILVGGLFGKATIGGQEVDPGGVYKGYVAKLDGDGNALWVRTYGTASGQHEAIKIFAVDVDAAGNIYFAGSLTGASDDLATAVDAQATGGLFAKLDKDGNVVWADTDSTIDHSRTVVASAGGAVAVAGMHRITGDATVKLYDESGALAWSRPFVGSATLHVEGIGLHADGHVAVAVGADPVTFGESVDFALGTEQDATSYSLDDNGMLLAAFDASGGRERWSVFYGGSANQQTFAIPRGMRAATTDGHLILVGQSGNLDLGTGVIPGLTSFVARIPQ